MNADAIRNFIRNDLLNDPAMTIEPDEDLLISGILDSLSITRLIAELESQTGTVIPPEDVTLENFGSLDRMVSYLASR